MNESARFLSSFGKTGRVLRRSLFKLSLGRVLAIWLAALALAGLSDYLAGWEIPARKVLVGALAGLAVGGVIWAWWRAARTPSSEIARRADAYGEDLRREIQAALDLSRSHENAEPLQAYLTGKAVARASERLEALPVRSMLSRREKLAAWRWALGAAICLAGLASLHPKASFVVAGRLLRPASELPPYSPYTFDPVQGADADRVIYGKDVSLAAEISGPPFREEVRLITRPAGGGPVNTLPTFRETGNRHARKLEGVTQPLEYAFTVGRARSAWRPVEVIYQPQIEEAEIEIAPPAYSGLSGSRFFLGAEDLRGLRGTEVRLEAASNRPLSGGVMEGREPQGREVVQRVQATPVEGEGNRVKFSWLIEGDLVWTVDLVDVRGGRMENPVLVAQRLIPDEKPKIDLVEPGPLALATPESEIKLAWDVADDLGLERIDLLRSAERFRDRAQSLPEGPGEKRVRLERSTLLGNLGVRPGQTLEFLLEARDKNPNLLGIGSSPSARIQIISEEEYAERIRLRTTLEEFSARYRVLREQLEAALSALDALAKAAESGDPARLDAVRKAAIEAQREAAKWFGTFAEDFPAFATDRQMNEMSGGLRNELERNAAELENRTDWSDPAKAKALAEQLSKRLQPGSEQLAQQESQAAEISAIGGVLELAAELEAIRAEQWEISERLSRLARELALGLTENRGAVPALRARQQINHDRLEKVRGELPGRIARLPEGYDSLRDGAAKVLEMLGTLQVPKQMTDSAEQAGQGKVPGAAEDAGLALANLDQILGSEKNDFCQACQGGVPGSFGGGESAKQALAQMMEALRGRARGASGGGKPGAGQSGGGLLGAGARGGSGTTMQGIQLDIPLIGPPRVQLSRPGGGMAGPGREPGAAGDGGGATTAVEALPGSETAAPAGRAWTPAEIPPKYREAVRRFFSEEPHSSNPVTQESKP